MKRTRTTYRLIILVICLFTSQTLLAEEKTTDENPTLRLSNERSYLYEIGVEVSAGASNLRNVTVTMPSLQNWREQKVELLKRKKPPRSKVTQKRHINSGTNLICKVPFIGKGKTVTISQVYRVTRLDVELKLDFKSLRKPSSKEQKAFKIFLIKAPGVDTNNRNIRKAAKFLYDSEKSTWDNVEGFYYWIRNNVEYQYHDDFRGAANTLDKKIGDCDDMSALFIGFCRVNGIPARTVWIQDHAYPEFYLVDKSGQGHWIPVQISGQHWIGKMFEARPIFQKGDSFYDSVLKKKTHYLPQSVYAYGGKVSMKPFKRLIEETASKESE